jgi:hypothetical protein
MQTIKKRLSSLVYLVRPLMLMFVGIVVLSLGVASLFLWLYRGMQLPDVFYYLMLQFMPGPTRGIVLLVLGLGVLAAGIWHLSGVVVIRLQEGELAEGEVILGYRQAKRPPRVVVMSGGPGMLMLANLGEHVERLTCITPVQDPVEYYYRASSLFNTQNIYYVVPTPTPVKVFGQLDDGTRMNIMHINSVPGLAHHHVEDLILETEETGKNGHLPVTRLAREAIKNADAIILGPGSLFESILPNFLIDELRTAVQQSKAAKIYICNLMTEPGLTAGFGVGEHIRQIKQFGGFTPDYVLVNVQRIDEDVRRVYADAHQAPVYLSPEEYEETTVLAEEGVSRRHVMVEDSVVIESDLASSVIQYTTKINQPEDKMAVRVLRHDPQKLTNAILKLLQRSS